MFVAQVKRARGQEKTRVAGINGEGASNLRCRRAVPYPALGQLRQGGPPRHRAGGSNVLNAASGLARVTLRQLNQPLMDRAFLRFIAVADQMAYALEQKLGPLRDELADPTMGADQILTLTEIRFWVAWAFGESSIPSQVPFLAGLIKAPVPARK